MDFISKTAKNFTDRHFYDIGNGEEIIAAARNIINNIDDTGDKIKFLAFVLNKNNDDYEDHKRVCSNTETCQLNNSHESIAYFLTQELNRLGIQLNEDTFTEDERAQADLKLNQIINDLNEIKAGQQVLFEEFSKEINELRELYYLGKKKWYQLMIGKSFDMVASGIISETLSKNIIEKAKLAIPGLLQ